jgi:hypothetical protein
MLKILFGHSKYKIKFNQFSLQRKKITTINILELWFGNWRKGPTRETATKQNHDFLYKKFEVTVLRDGYFF